MEQDYKKMLADSLRKIAEWSAKRDDMEVQIAKQVQFARATINMLPDDERDAFEKLIEQVNTRSVGLTQSIRTALFEAPADAWITGPALRQRLIESGFDFSRYTSNPLASIYSIARRFKPEEVETASIDGAKAFRLKREHRNKIQRLAKKVAL